MFRLLVIIVKQIANYAGKYCLRQLGVFGLSGSIKQIIRSKSKTQALMKLLGKNVLKKFGKLNFFRDLYKEGFAYALKRVGVSMTPMEIKKLYYFLSPMVKKGGNSLRINQNKDKVWTKINNLDNNSKAKTLDKLVNSKPNNKQEIDTKKELLDRTFWFMVASPESGAFAVLPQFANISQETYGVPIKGIIGNFGVKYYHFDDLGSKHWDIVKAALTTNDYGREVYSLIRSELPMSRKILIKELYYNKI